MPLKFFFVLLIAFVSGPAFAQNQGLLDEVARIELAIETAELEQIQDRRYYVLSQVQLPYLILSSALTGGVQFFASTPLIIASAAFLHYGGDYFHDRIHLTEAELRRLQDELTRVKDILGEGQ